MVSNTDSEAWNLEVERAAPKLKVTVRADGRDWRSHLEQVSGLDVFFRQIKSFIRFRLAFVFGLQTYFLIDFSKIYRLKAKRKYYEQFDLTKKYV